MSINRAPWPPHYSPHHGRHMRLPLRQKYHPSLVGGSHPTTLLYATGKRDSAHLYGRFSSQSLKCPLSENSLISKHTSSSSPPCRNIRGNRKIDSCNSSDSINRILTAVTGPGPTPSEEVHIIIDEG
ncbi:hypothetical protein AVEN_86541-1 [Araneus ventricosus]|uniref:Uncharacterized protein n=1 Tax=Araneus ventricosus TaxID=182803 RepID=A0A4Y2FWU0_ARAVE|nr:hypothetical protein AVEN_86541-1 [Araneus ventricosus]